MGTSGVLAAEQMGFEFLCKCILKLVKITTHSVMYIFLIQSLVTKTNKPHVNSSTHANTTQVNTRTITTAAAATKTTSCITNRVKQ